MKVQILTAVLISAYLIVICTEATVVRKCQGKQVIPNNYNTLCCVEEIFSVDFVTRKTKEQIHLMKAKELEMFTSAENKTNLCRLCSVE